MPDVVTWAPAAIALLLLWVAGLVLWVWGVRRFYRLRHERPVLHKTGCADGWELAVYHRPATLRRFAEPVLLCHGLAANHYNWDFDPPYSVAHHLADAGFDCFSVEWRGTGASRRAPPGVSWRAGISVDDHIRLDAPALIDFALKRTGARQAFWVGHSMGGIIGCAVAQSEHGARLKGLVTLATPLFFNEYIPALRWAIQLGARVGWPFGLRHRVLIGAAPFLGYLALPLSDVVLNAKHMEPRVLRQVAAHLMASISWKTLRQFQDWILNDALRSYDRTLDYRAGLRTLTLPALVIGGSVDRLAPPISVKTGFDLLSSPDRTLHLFGREHGHTDEYGHADLVFGRGAPGEVYPVLARWLTARATALTADQPPGGTGGGPLEGEALAPRPAR